MAEYQPILLKQIKFVIILLLAICTLMVAGFYIYKVHLDHLTIVSPDAILQKKEWQSISDIPSIASTFSWQADLNNRVETAKQNRRQERIDKVESYFARYGSKLQGYGYIFVDQAEACGGDYRILVGIAGSESGLGRVMYKKYNPFGYLNRVQYDSLEEALNYLACQVSRQHIAPCGDDLYCLARRYAGPQDDLSHFVNKVKWFAQNVS